MLRRSYRRRGLRLFGAPVTAVWLIAACGVEAPPPQEEGVLALDLQSGEQRRFDSRQMVPAGWGICPDDRCVVPPGLPCEKLGLRLCIDQPQCKAQLVCELEAGIEPWTAPAAPDGDLAVAPPLEKDADAPGLDCKMSCVARSPVSCAGAEDQATCLGIAKKRCEWVPVDRDRCRYSPYLDADPALGHPPMNACPMRCREATPPPPTPDGACFVGGCSNELCTAERGAVSICMFPPPKGLPPKGAACGRQPDGDCGWILPQ
ncbi:MAG: hypothetical protein IPL40_08905 [Proteobacteria bacterium]|nr:hypothetical protein [Pseudomonadota bacterium]